MNSDFNQHSCIPTRSHLNKLFHFNYNKIVRDGIHFYPGTWSCGRSRVTAVCLKTFHFPPNIKCILFNCWLSLLFHQFTAKKRSQFAQNLVVPRPCTPQHALIWYVTAHGHWKCYASRAAMMDTSTKACCAERKVRLWRMPSTRAVRILMCWSASPQIIISVSNFWVQLLLECFVVTSRPFRDSWHCCTGSEFDQKHSFYWNKTVFIILDINLVFLIV